MGKPEFNELQPPESSRTYVFPGGDTIELKEVKRIAVSASGTHRLETEDGKKHIIPPTWLHIKFEATDWTF